MIVVTEKSKRNRFIRFLSAALILVAGLVICGIIDSLYLPDKSLVLLFVFVFFLPLWLFSISHTDYFFKQKQILEVTDDEIRINGGEMLIEVPFNKLDSIRIKEENKFMALSISYDGKEKNFNLQ